MRLRRIIRSRIVIWSVALAVGWATANVVARARDEGRAWGVRRDVVVVVRDVRAGAIVRRSDVAVRSVPMILVPPDSARTVDMVTGRATRAPLFMGQILVAAQVAGSRLSPARVLIGSGRRGMTVATGDARPPLRVGDRVDLIAGRGVADGPGPDGVVAADAEVIDVGERSVTVAVIESEAVVVAEATAAGALLLALRGG